MTWVDDHATEVDAATASVAAQSHRLQAWGETLAEILSSGGRLLAAGNGGSAAEAQHLTAELVGRFVEDRMPFSAIALSAETSSITAIVNDYGSDELFARQVAAHGRPGDVLVLLSTSGRSPNIIRAAERARAVGVTTWALTGPGPNPLTDLCDDAIAVDAPSVAAVQTGHLIAIHALCAEVDAQLGPEFEAHDTRPHVVVVGDVLLDRDTHGRVGRITPDAPAMVVDVTETCDGPGGAALTASLCARSGARVTLVAPWSDDPAGVRLRRTLGPSIRIVGLPQHGTTRIKTRVRSDGHTLVRLDEGGPATPAEPDDALVSAIENVLRTADVVLVSDYGAGTTRSPRIRGLLEQAAEHGRVLWDPHPRGGTPVSGCTLVTPNASEADRWAPDQPPDRQAIALREALAARAVCVTAGAVGAFLADGGTDPNFVPATPAAGDACGAGDRFIATAAVALARGSMMSEAVTAAVAETSAWVAAGGSEGHRAPPSRRRLAPPEPEDQDLGRLGDLLRARGTLVATGGCFDLLHVGHVATLQAARRLGDALVVLVNSDASVRRLKGPGRPALTADDRVGMLRALDCVDAVVVFSEVDPSAALDKLKPHVWAKGGDYGAAPLAEAAVVEANGGRVVLLPYLAGRSTTGLIQRLALAP